MIIVRARAYVGPNIIAPHPLAHVTVTIEGKARWPGGSADAAASAALLQLLPGLARHPGDSGSGESFAKVLARAPGPPLGLVAARVASELQRLTGSSLKAAGCRVSTDGSRQEIYVDYDDPDIGILAAQLAVYLVLALLPPEQRPANQLSPNFDARRTRDNFLKNARAMALDQTSLALIDEAQRRDIPWFILDRKQRIVQMGQGVYRRRIRESVTDRTSAIATWVQRDKTSTVQVLGNAHLPVPQQTTATSADGVLAAARAIGQAVVVKPLDSKKGQGVSLCVSGESGLRAAFERARRYSATVIVESFIPGADHRVLVIDGKVVAAARRIPAAVTGDGQRSVAELVAEANKDPRRGPGFSNLMNLIEWDDEVDAELMHQGLARDSVPPAGIEVRLRETANISTGGTAVDVTDQIHPANKIMLERAARVAGLDVVGIDFITPDISRSYRDVGGAICEINISPGLRPHQVAAQVPGAKPRDVVGPIVDLLFPRRRNGRIPIASITGTNGKTTTSRMLAHILRHAHGSFAPRRIGLVTTSGVKIDDDVVAEGDFAGITGARVLLNDPTVEAAILETSRGGIVKSGLGFSWCDVGAVLNIADDHLHLHGVETLDDMAAAKKCVAEAARRRVVLNADDSRCRAMTAGKAPEQVCFFTLGSLDAALRGHVENGGLAVTLETPEGREMLCLHTKGNSEAVIAVADIPAALAGGARHNIQNAMAALGLAQGLGVALPEIREALAGFRSDYRDNPGRLNFFEGFPFRVLHDFAHNPPGMKVLCDSLNHLTVDGRRICMISGIGHRHPEHIGPVAKIIADQFDIFVCSRRESMIHLSESTRDFPLEEIPQRIADALRAEGVDPKAVLTVDLDTEAVDRALEMAREGDLVVLLTGTVEWTGDRVRKAAARRAEEAAAG